jgi:hypothetical protein
MPDEISHLLTGDIVILSKGNPSEKNREFEKYLGEHFPGKRVRRSDYKGHIILPEELVIAEYFQPRDTFREQITGLFIDGNPVFCFQDGLSWCASDLPGNRVQGVIFNNSLSEGLNFQGFTSGSPALPAYELLRPYLDKLSFIKEQVLTQFKNSEPAKYL